MSDDKDKTDLFKILVNTNYAVWIPEHKKIVKDIDKREEQEKEQLTDAMAKLNKKLGKLDE